MKIKNLVLGAAAAAVLTSCGGGVDKKDPKSVTEGFVNAILSEDWSGAKGLATEKSGEAIDGMESMAGMAALSGEKKEAPKLEKVECEEPAEDKCTCNATTSDGETTPYTLVKNGEDWQVDFNKGLGSGMDAMGDAMGNAMEGAIDEGMDALDDAMNEAADEINASMDESHEE